MVSDYVWMASHTTKSPHGGPVKNIGHLENSYRCKCCVKCIEEKIFTQDPSGGKRRQEKKKEQAFLDCKSDGDLQ